MRVAIPRFGESIAPCFEHSSTMAIFTIEQGRVVSEVDFPLETRNPYDRVRLMKLEQVDVVISGGVQDLFEDMLREDGIEVISWVSGTVSGLLGRFLDGRLTPGTAHPPISLKSGCDGDDSTSHT